MTDTFRRLRPVVLLALAALVLLPLVACGGDEPPPPGTTPGDVEPISSSDDGPPPNIRWDLPGEWVEETPTSTMRMAQARIPGAYGPAEFTVFYFGPGGGGGTEANIERWIGQMEVAEGTEPQRMEYEANGYQVTQIEVGGTLKAATMGMGPATDQPNYRMLAAVVEGPGGPWFFKITGPDKTVTDAKDGFRQLIESLGPA